MGFSSCYRVKKGSILYLFLYSNTSGGDLSVDDWVLLTDDETTMKKLLSEVNYGWDAEMKSMLGEMYPILEVRDKVVAVPSPNGEQNGKCFVPKTAVREVDIQSILNSGCKNHGKDWCAKHGHKSCNSTLGGIGIKDVCGESCNTCKSSKCGITNIVFREYLLSANHLKYRETNYIVEKP